MCVHTKNGLMTSGADVIANLLGLNRGYNVAAQWQSVESGYRIACRRLCIQFASRIPCSEMRACLTGAVTGDVI